VSAPGSGKQRKSSIPSALLPSLIVATVGGDTPDSGLRMDFAFGRTGNWIFIYFLENKFFKL